MPKDQMIHGMPWPNDSLKMSVEHDGELNLLLMSERRSDQENLLSTLKQCGFSPEDVTCITQVDHTKRTTTAIYFEQKKTPEKSGVQ
jgi:hypothetical protein